MCFVSLFTEFCPAHEWYQTQTEDERDLDCTGVDPGPGKVKVTGGGPPAADRGTETQLPFRVRQLWENMIQLAQFNFNKHGILIDVSKVCLSDHLKLWFVEQKAENYKGQLEENLFV